MAIVKGNLTANDTAAIGTSPNTATITTHNQNTGTDGLLVVTVFYINTKNCTGVTWNGVSLTKEITVVNTNAGAAVQYDVWYLTSPATGVNDLVYTFDTGGGNCTSLLTSFTGASGLNSATSTAANTPYTQSITISAGSMIMGIGTSRYTLDSIDCINIDGTGFGFGSCDIDTAISLAQVAVETRNATLTAGSKDVIIDTIADSFQADNTRVEILAAAATPDIIISTGTLSGFTYVEGSGPSAEQTFTVSGNDLTSSVTLTAPTNYEISESSGTGYTSPITLTQTSGDLDGEPVTIYVRLKAGLTAGSYNNEDVSLTATGATTETVTMSGSVTAASTRRVMIV